MQSEGEAERQGEEERKERVCRNCIMPKKRKHEAELSHLTLLFVIITNVLHRVEALDMHTIEQSF